ncbi:MAG: sulfatase-like hydrolase/transferase, partial [Caldilineaceae bacterium]|nr:sulfatase-like hydrolase/transferase [Caldilineaceae bacterium]
KWGVDPQRDPTHFGFHLYLSEREYARQRQAMGLSPRPHTNRWFGEVDPHITPEQSQLAWGADMTIQLLQHAARQEQPFFLRWDPSEPHLPNVVPEPYASMYPPESIPPWPNFVDDLAGKPYIQRQQRRTWGIDGWTWQEWAPIVGRYLGEITLLDHQIGRVLTTLEELGLADNTVVIYSADHGDLCGSHGMIDKHYVMYEELVRVPLIVRWPGHVAAGQTITEFVSSELDLAATICDSAVGVIPSTFAGQSFLPRITQPTPGISPWQPRDDIFVTYFGNQFGLYSQRMVRDERWKYVWNATAADELYDISTDPGELYNRAADFACAEQRATTSQRLLMWMQQTNDRLLNPWTEGVLRTNR